MNLPYLKPTLQNLSSHFLTEAGVEVWVRREDQNHPLAGGNKWWKLRYNISSALAQNKTSLVTFGGAWSNHIRATAAAARATGMRSYGFIRGERTEPLNDVLLFAESQGMILKFVSRDIYSQKDESDFLKDVAAEFENAWIIPEGGSNAEGFLGCADWGRELAHEAADYFAMPCGTGTTAAGVIAGLGGAKEVIGISVLKGNFMKDTITRILQAQTGNTYSNWTTDEDHHFGGYAKSTEVLRRFVKSFRDEFGIPLEPVYTGKMMYALFEMIRARKFKRGSVIMALHTGGIYESGGTEQVVADF